MNKPVMPVSSLSLKLPTTSGAVSYASPVLTWTGNLTPGQAATITYSVTVIVDNPESGDDILTDTVTSAASGSNCPSGTTDPRCTTTVPVSELIIDSTADVSATESPSTMPYSVPAICTTAR